MDLNSSGPYQCATPQVHVCEIRCVGNAQVRRAPWSGSQEKARPKVLLSSSLQTADNLDNSLQTALLLSVHTVKRKDRNTSRLFSLLQWSQVALPRGDIDVHLLGTEARMIVASMVRSLLIR